MYGKLKNEVPNPEGGAPRSVVELRRYEMRLTDRAIGSVTVGPSEVTQRHVSSWRNIRRSTKKEKTSTREARGGAKGPTRV